MKWDVLYCSYVRQKATRSEKDDVFLCGKLCIGKRGLHIVCERGQWWKTRDLVNRVYVCWSVRRYNAPRCVRQREDTRNMQHWSRESVCLIILCHLPAYFSGLVNEAWKKEDNNTISQQNIDDAFHFHFLGLLVWSSKDLVIFSLWKCDTVHRSGWQGICAALMGRTDQV